MDKWVKRWDVASFSGSGTYKVSIDIHGNIGCSCWPWRRTRKDCKHIKRLKAEQPREFSEDALHFSTEDKPTTLRPKRNIIVGGQP